MSATGNDYVIEVLEKALERARSYPEGYFEFKPEELETLEIYVEFPGKDGVNVGMVVAGRDKKRKELLKKLVDQIKEEF